MSKIGQLLAAEAERERPYSETWFNKYLNDLLKEIENEQENKSTRAVSPKAN